MPPHTTPAAPAPTSTVAAGFDPVQRSWVPAPSPPHAIAVPPLDGVLRVDSGACDAAAGDFGGLVHNRPSAVLQPRSVHDIAALVRIAREIALPVTPRGQGHSAMGQSQAAGGITIEMSALAREPAVDADRGTVTVSAGSTWRQVLAATLLHRLRPPVLTNYLGLSVGGTLSVGGLDGGSYHFGAQTDHVTELTVVTGTGDIITCNPTTHPDLFTAVLGGLGQIGIITDATIRLTRARTHAVEHELLYDNPAAMLRDARRLARTRRADRIIVFAVPRPERGWAYHISATLLSDHPTTVHPDLAAGLTPIGQRQTTRPFMAFADRVRPPEGNAANPWLDVLVPDNTATDYLAGVLAAIDQAHRTAGDPRALVVLAPFTPRPFTRGMLRVPATDHFVISVQHAAPDQTTAHRMLNLNDDLEQRATKAGGTRYPYCAAPTTPEQWAAHFGPSWTAFGQAKHRWDPDHVLTPGPGIFEAPLPDTARTSAAANHQQEHR